LAGGTRGLGYLLKERVGRVETFLEALHRVADGGTAIDPDVVAQLFARRRATDQLAALTGREREVLALMAQGLGNTAISQRLLITDNAVHSTSATSSPSSTYQSVRTVTGASRPCCGTSRPPARQAEG